MMEFVPGQELTDLICTKNKQGTYIYDFSGPLYNEPGLSFDDVTGTMLSIWFQAAAGLSFMHEQHVLHQGVIPSLR